MICISKIIINALDIRNNPKSYPNATFDHVKVSIITPTDDWHRHAIELQENIKQDLREQFANAIRAKIDVTINKKPIEKMFYQSQ